MAKYSLEFKFKVVREYLEGTLGYRLLARKYGIPSKSPIESWVQAYKAFGEDGLRRKRSKKVYSVQFKLDVLHFIKRTGASYQDTAIEFNMNNPSLIANWKRTFLKEGVEGLKPKSKGCPTMSKDKKAKPVKTEEKMSREEQLERENELLRLEIAYLKKLDAFQENPNAFLEKHKQQWHSNSKKKGSN
ncbi:helix-turn-helix domain-containing protein [Sporosarcina ureilytica]|uniref:Transposase n=1 Tax=Sporosarcina ureilytica TaxID=298596 RepID=A0A1D8JJ56_9BACL|nr:helix-turn-helix domain-containing protein [Sporosarcina ureilytica]AOV06869.1 transposase [Sporosarcina ureilytica]AOV07981.1 transposase [Sporosarcina ureilytica]AOV08741.1 transposase [Sporosarcina ureilytica]